MRPTRSFADYDAMLADPELEAVVIATSDAFHVPAALRALEAGKHVLCEKPLATGIEEAESLRAAVQGQRQGAAGRAHEAVRRGACRRRRTSSTGRWGRWWR